MKTKTLAMAAALCGAAACGGEPLLSLDAPIDNWYDAVPLGNGGAGALLWGGGGTLDITLDRADFWHNVDMPSYRGPDFTWEKFAAAVERKDQEFLERTFLQANSPCATKLPGTRFVAKFAPGVDIKRFALTRENAVAEIELATPSGAKTVRAWFDDGDKLLSLQIPEGVEIVSREFLDNPSFKTLPGYPAAEISTEGGVATYRRSRRAGADNRFDRDFEAGVRFRAADAAPRSPFWAAFNAQSSVSIPDPEMQRLYDTAIYLYGAGARAGHPPLALQGLWTADNGKLPPWRGDYHNDLNTEMTYWAAGPAGCIEALDAFADFYMERLPEHRAFCKKLFSPPEGSEPAAVIPPTMGLAANPIGGWTAYTIPPVHGIWVFDTMCDAWLYAPSRAKAERLLAFGRELAAGLEYSWKKDGGARRFRVSCSPEINNNAISCFLDPNSSYERAILESFYRWLATLAAACGDKAEEAKWRSYSRTFGPPAVEADGTLRISAALPLKTSHRHASHLLGIFPLTNVPGEKDIDPARSVEHWENLGTKWWCGYSFAWAGCFEARLGRGDRAWRYLKDFQRAFVSRCGFHLNGDQLKCGLSNFKYKPFTLEGNFGYARGIQEMLMSCDIAGGKCDIKLFPALPEAWDGKEVSFENLRAPGGYRISARRAADGLVSWSGVAPDGTKLATLKGLPIGGTP